MVAIGDKRPKFEIREESAKGSDERREEEREIPRYADSARDDGVFF